MHESVGSPSTSTVQAPQCPSLQATFVPVKPNRSRSVSASEVPMGTSREYRPPLTRSSGSRRHRLDVGQVQEAGRQPPGLEALGVGAEGCPRLPQVTRCLEQVAD